MGLTIALLVFAFVVFRVGNRAYTAFTNGYSTWPILAGIAVIYTVVAAMRLLFGMQGPIFLGISLLCIIASQVIFRRGR